MFQSTPPHGWRLDNLTSQYDRQTVSIHATARVATVVRYPCTASTNRFNPRHRTGGDFENQLARLGSASFQSTPPHGWRHIPARPIIEPAMFQSTPPHGWRQFILKELLNEEIVSIHATARVATCRKGASRLLQSVSIHATARVATMVMQSAGPRPGGVSIHATARVATTYSKTPKRRRYGFNPRHRTGGDSKMMMH